MWHGLRSLRRHNVSAHFGTFAFPPSGASAGPSKTLYGAAAAAAVSAVAVWEMHRQSAARARLADFTDKCPHLCGKNLPAPVLAPGVENWKLLQTFSMKNDNPYRIEETPPAAPFLCDAHLRGAQAAPQLTELPVCGLEFEKDFYVGAKDKTIAWQLDGVCSEDQCAALIDMANEKGFVPALRNSSMRLPLDDPRRGDILELNPDSRDTYIVMMDCPQLAAWLDQRIGDALRSVPVPTGWRYDHINSFMRVLCYCKPGQRHEEHFDGMMRYPRNKYPEDHAYSKARSLLTVFIYLSEVPKDCAGATAFPPPHEKLDENHLRCQPVPGRVLLFSQNLWHTGEPLKAGAIKYVIRSDVMFVPLDA
eukprot:gnl/TRDRNA2_/TRDRNA2_175322_c0_seq1.p1 gnl/TRDRNA2_/TRDRNA2_175322_c0~~gnl/TRDRNA2_/TRDRNA2_175322_c0_seq1.p1  ORF type:complete len:395 (+),score=66.10 gnl/TRDRNA2_/TRDRNA2_175322_c0_seq1:98-1186(+)